MVDYRLKNGSGSNCGRHDVEVKVDEGRQEREASKSCHDTGIEVLWLGFEVKCQRQHR
jgi:hypothetical protein